VRLLRQCTLRHLHSAGPPARDITLLRETACRVLGVISPDALFLLWYTLGSPEPEGRRDVLPALDYLRDARAVPYLLRLLERRGQWPDGEMTGWFIVRALERIGDRRAIPVLWRLVEASRSPKPPTATSVELGREAKRVIESLEGGQAKRDRERLLRPAAPPSADLVRPADAPPFENASELPRPADPTRDTLLRPLMPSSENLLRPAHPTETAQVSEEQELLRATDLTPRPPLPDARSGSPGEGET
jgi:hypothetical protein